MVKIGTGPKVVVEVPGEKPQEYLKISGVKLKPGTVITSYTGGGGGYGKPTERDPLLVREDVLDGFVSVKRARSKYSVVISKRGKINTKATEKLRKLSA